jgi:16S rRNA C967 or C1407 C5-methylase (RsmB/RsmF family)
VLDRLAYDEIAAAPTRHSPVGVRLREKPSLNKHPMFLDGAVEVQDEGSQLLGMLVEPRRGEMVVDFCAGAGGKTLQMGAQMNSSAASTPSTSPTSASPSSRRGSSARAFRTSSRSASPTRTTPR